MADLDELLAELPVAVAAEREAGAEALAKETARADAAEARVKELEAAQQPGGFGSGPTIRVGHDGDVGTAAEAVAWLARGATVLFRRGEAHPLAEPFWIDRDYVRLADYGSPAEPMAVLLLTADARQPRLVQFYKCAHGIVEGLKFDAAPGLKEPTGVHINATDIAVRACTQTANIHRFSEGSVKLDPIGTKYPGTIDVCPHCGQDSSRESRHAPDCPDKRLFAVPAVRPVIAFNRVPGVMGSYLFYGSDGTWDVTVEGNEVTTTQYYLRFHGLRGQANVVRGNHLTYLAPPPEPGKPKVMRGFRYANNLLNDPTRLLVEGNVMDGIDPFQFRVGDDELDAPGLTLRDNRLLNLGHFMVGGKVKDLRVTGGTVQNTYQREVFSLDGQAKMYVEGAALSSKEAGLLSKYGTVTVGPGVTHNGQPIPPTPVA